MNIENNIFDLTETNQILMKKLIHKLNIKRNEKFI